MSYYFCIVLELRLSDHENDGLSIFHGTLDHPTFFVNVTCIAAYIVMLIAAGADTRAFLLSAVFKLLVLTWIPVGMVIAIVAEPDYQHGTPMKVSPSKVLPWCTVLYSILMVLCAAAGLSGLARVPWIGKCLAGALAPGCHICKCCRRRAVNRSDGSGESPARVEIAAEADGV
eukprot:CAMPEP_0195135046 /NCGR_PEP_ID=MMETSP0448-20130528/151761_1 /TAXON_ID=66468 /ORGANISM="Heterocapsa triquestra, Strain CCMP 448" /LENGTH=172 /DNA_ID=CAMNT_0040173157 /DNA_START=21 /DNA_END=539 /DNA_ORIENTATION=-